jgi:tetratricopeptide (TPR) repeat protein
MKPYRVCLVVIAQNEAPRIARLLGSVAPWVSEMLVLDTGSTDGTGDIAHACGARVERFNWCNDFAAARNAALDAAAGDWHVILDADEWLIDGGEVLQALAGRAPSFVGALHLEDRFFDGDWRTAHVDISRVLPGPVRYRGRVHEQPVHALPVQPLQVRVGHDGYAPEALAAKRGRNRALLQAELAASGQDAYLWYQLGKDHAVYAEHAQASDCFSKAAQRLQGAEPWRHDLAARALYSMKCAGRHEEAVAYGETQLAACSESPDFFFALGDLLLDWAAREPVRGEALLPMIEAAWTRCLEIGERPALHGAVAGRGSVLAAHNLVVMYESLGHVEQAQRMRAAYPAAFVPAI